MRTQWERLRSCEVPHSTQSRGERSGEESRGPATLLAPLRFLSCKVLRSTISAPLSLPLSQRKGIQQGTGGLSRSPAPREMEGGGGCPDNNGQESHDL